MSSYCQAPNVDLKRFYDDGVATRGSDGTIFAFNAVTIRVWDLLATPLEPEQIVEALLKEFAVEPEQCQRELAALLKQMVDERIVIQT